MGLTANQINSDGIFYHAAPLILKPGSIIKKGNWGRIISLYDNVSITQKTIFFRESVLEQVRATEFPDKPSRLNCVFTSSSEIDAIRYIQFNNKFNLLYEVKICTPDCKYHIGNWSKVEPANPMDHLAMVETARNYWRISLIADCLGYRRFPTPQPNGIIGAFINSAEILLDSDIEIIRMITL